VREGFDHVIIIYLTLMKVYENLGRMAQELTKVSKIDVIVLALANCGGSTSTADTEDVAVAAFDLAPETFRWRKYAKQIDLDMVRTTLRHAAERDDPRVAGSIREGWSLTKAGVSWVSRHGKSAATGVGEAPPANTIAVRKENVASKREGERIRAHVVFRKWRAGDQITTHDAGSVFRIDDYTPQRERTLKMQRLEEAVAGDGELAAFVMAARVIAEAQLKA